MIHVLYDKLKCLLKMRASVEYMIKSDLVITRDMLREILEADGREIQTLKMISEGWDFKVHRLNGGHVIRVPRRKGVSQKMREEIEFLKGITDNPWVEVPRYDIIIQFPSGTLVAGYPFIRGKRLSFTMDGYVSGNIPSLALFTQYVHNRGINDSVTVTASTDLASYRKDAQAVYQKIRHRIPWKLHAVFEKSLGTDIQFNGRRVLTHQDLRPDHILVSSGKLFVIDWTDVSWAYPWEDFVWLWMYYGDGFIREFSAHYEGWSPDWHQWIVTVGLWKSLIEYDYGRQTADRNKIEVSRRVWKRLLEKK